MKKTYLFLSLLLIIAFSFNTTAQSGSIDLSFNPGTGADSWIETFSLQPDGKIIIGGDFTTYNGTAINRIARLNADGILDTSFNIGTGANNYVRTTSLQPDGKIIIGGDFTTYNGTARNRIARLNIDGTLDNDFNPGTGASSFIWTTSLQPDGKIIIGGDFNSYNGTARKKIARLNEDGTLDTVFNPGTGVDNWIQSSSLQLDGKIIVGGDFTTYNGTASSRIARLNVDGTLDTSFNIGTGANGFVRTFSLQPDGKIFVGGDFTIYNGTAINRIARLNADGTLDTIFNPGTGATYNSVWTSALQPDGKIIIGGDFTSYNGTAINKIARLNTEGSLDADFDPGTGADNDIWASILQPDGKIIIGGNFTSYNGVVRNRVARLCDCSVSASYSFIDNGIGNYSFSNNSTGSYNKTHWAFGDGTTSTATNLNHTFSTNGTYVVVLTVIDSISKCMAYNVDTIVVTGVVTPLQCTAGFVMYPDSGDVTVVNSSTGTNLTYLWDFGDGNTSTLQTPSHTYSNSGSDQSFLLCLSIDDGAGCVDMYCDSIGENGVVFNKQTGFTINVIAPPLATQVNKQAAITSAMSIYPNPTGKKLNVVFNKNEPYQLKIAAIDGKLIETKTIVGNTTLDVNSYPSGMYFITATNNEGKVYQSKFVKE